MIPSSFRESMRLIKNRYSLSLSDSYSPLNWIFESASKSILFTRFSIVLFISMSFSRSSGFMLNLSARTSSSSFLLFLLVISSLCARFSLWMFLLVSGGILDVITSNDAPLTSADSNGDPYSRNMWSKSKRFMNSLTMFEQYVILSWLFA